MLSDAPLKGWPILWLSIPPTGHHQPCLHMPRSALSVPTCPNMSQHVPTCPYYDQTCPNDDQTPLLQAQELATFSAASKPLFNAVHSDDKAATSRACLTQEISRQLSPRVVYLLFALIFGVERGSHITLVKPARHSFN